jgi:hypothetical protein
MENNPMIPFHVRLQEIYSNERECMELGEDEGIIAFQTREIMQH